MKQRVELKSLNTHRIFVLVGRLLNMGFLRSWTWALFFLTYALMIFPLQIHSFAEVILFSDDTEYPCLSY